MAKAPDGVEAEFVKILHIPACLRDPSKHKDTGKVRAAFAEELRILLADNHPIIVKGWTPDCISSFTARDIAILRASSDTAEIEVQG